MEKTAARAVATNCNVRGGDTLVAQKPPRRQRIVISCGKRMFRRQPVADGERARAGGSSGLSDHAAVTENGTGAIAAAVEEQQNACGIASRSNRPFPRQTAEVNRSELHVRGNGPHGADFFDAEPSLRPTDRPRLRRQQCANGADLALSHRTYLVRFRAVCPNR